MIKWKIKASFNTYKFTIPLLTNLLLNLNIASKHSIKDKIIKNFLLLIYFNHYWVKNA